MDLEDLFAPRTTSAQERPRHSHITSWPCQQRYSHSHIQHLFRLRITNLPTTTTHLYPISHNLILISPTPPHLPSPSPQPNPPDHAAAHSSPSPSPSPSLSLPSNVPPNYAMSFSPCQHHRHLFARYYYHEIIKKRIASLYKHGFHVWNGLLIGMDVSFLGCLGAVTAAGDDE
jgi:hypothetical protein